MEGRIAFLFFGEKGFEFGGFVAFFFFLCLMVYLLVTSTCNQQVNYLESGVFLYQNMLSSAHKSIETCDNIYFLLKLHVFSVGLEFLSPFDT